MSATPRAAEAAFAAERVAAAPEVAWPAQITREHVMKWVRRRLPGAEQVRADLYHHPMLGVVFQWHRPFAQPLMAHALVDLVGGRAYAAEHWDDVEFLRIGEVSVSDAVMPPARRVSDAEATATARRLVNGVLLRRRRLDFAGRLAENRDPLFFGKPNWWIQATDAKRKVEIIIDGLNGNHYVFAA